MIFDPSRNTIYKKLHLYDTVNEESYFMTKEEYDKHLKEKNNLKERSFNESY